LKEKEMKRALMIAGGLLYALSWQAHAEDAGTDTTAQTQQSVADSVGGQPATTTMSGGPAQGLTRAQVYQQLLQSQQSGEAARMQELFKGGN
jgi:hypothetical protein